VRRANRASRYSLSDEVTTFFPSKTIVPFPAPEPPVREERSGARERQALKGGTFAPEGGTVERTRAPEEPTRGARETREKDRPVGTVAEGDEPASKRRAIQREEPAADRPGLRKDLPNLLAKPKAQPDPMRSATTTKIAPATLSDLRRTVRQLGSPGTLALLAAGALAVIFALGMVVGRIVTSASAPKAPPVALVPPPADPAVPSDGAEESAGVLPPGPQATAAPATDEPSEARDEEPAAGNRELEMSKADEAERTKELAVVTVDPVKPAARRTPARPQKRGGDRAAAAPKRAAVAKNGGGPSSPTSTAKTPANTDQNNAEDLKAASAADELARGQLEAAMK
jgi:hypothetical protein